VNIFVKLFKSRKIKVKESKDKFLSNLESNNSPNQKTVVIAEDGAHLKWPVIFLYPQYGQTDFIEAFDEETKYSSLKVK
jgi:hypothetical protein